MPTQSVKTPQKSKEKVGATNSLKDSLGNIVMNYLKSNQMYSINMFSRAVRDSIPIGVDWDDVQDELLWFFRNRGMGT